MEFEFDQGKSQVNLAKHGLDFEQARGLWDDPDLLQVRARTTDEPRWLVVARLEGRIWAAVITYRGDTIRIISVRRARQEEATLYEGEDI